MDEINGKNVRSAGILLPISSLASSYGIGTFGEKAYEFVDFLFKSGQKCWQILPIGPTGYGDSPYQSFSAFAGNPYFIDLDMLIEEGLLHKANVENLEWGNDTANISYDLIFKSRFKVLRIAFDNFKEKSSNEYRAFCGENQYWLDDYALYMSVKTYFDNKSWLEWDEDIKIRKSQAMEKYKIMLAQDIEFWKFLQYKFFEQWYKLKKHANEKGIKIIGDIPLYVSMDSADTWANVKQFLFDENYNPTVVAGCPPDCFSEDGQLWGNSIYDWEAMERDDFNWWRKRIAFSSTIYNTIRIDHFIGIVRYYAIAAGEKTARNGEFHDGPGYKLINAIDESIGESSIIAEDLGVVVKAVKDLMDKSGYPGMKIIQFAFDGDVTNEHLPMNYDKNCCVYLGTHDNDTIISAVEKMSEYQKNYIKNYLGVKNLDNIVWDLIRLTYSSVSKFAIIQMQDLLMLDNLARMNTPSTIGDNWRWRISDDLLTDELAEKLRLFVQIYGR